MDRLLKYLIWPPVWGLAQVIRIIGVASVTRIAHRHGTGKAVAGLARFLLGKRNHYLDDNLARIFPLKSQAERDQIKYQYFANMLITAAESICMDGSEFRRTRFVGTEALLAAKEQGKGILFVSGHFNNWEINRRNIEALGFPIWALYRDFSHTRFNYLDINQQHRVGQHMVSTRDIPRLISQLDQGDHAHMLVDIKTRQGRNGVLLDFAGHPAWTSVFAADIANSRQLQIIITFTERDGQGGYTQTFYPIHHSARPTAQLAADTAARAQAIALTRQINDVLTMQLNMAPASWLLWDTNRWGV